MFKFFKALYRFITCKKSNEIKYEQIIPPPKDIKTTDPIKRPIVKTYDYNYGTRYYG